MAEAVHRVDCSLQGHTVVQAIMTWLLIQPWIIPQLHSMYTLWVWVVVYVAWTATFRIITGERAFDDMDVAYRVFLISLTLAISTVKKHYLEKTQRLKFLQDLEQRESSRNIF